MGCSSRLSAAARGAEARSPQYRGRGSRGGHPHPALRGQVIEAALSIPPLRPSPGPPAAAAAAPGRGRGAEPVAPGWELPGTDGERPGGGSGPGPELPSQQRDRAGGGASLRRRHFSCRSGTRTERSGAGGADASGAEPAGGAGPAGAAPGAAAAAGWERRSGFYRFLEQTDGEAEAGTGSQELPESPGRRSAAVPPGCPRTATAVGHGAINFVPNLHYVF